MEEKTLAKGRNVNVITDLNGNKIVMINDIIFQGKKSINWADVKN